MRSRGRGLLARHWSELTAQRYRQVLPLDPDWRAYYELEERGHLLVLVAEVEGELAGYSVNIVTRHPHSAGSLVATNDLLFIDKPYRRGGLGLHLIEETEAAARERGCSLLMIHNQPGSRLHELLDHRGYGIFEIVQARAF